MTKKIILSLLLAASVATTTAAPVDTAAASRVAKHFWHNVLQMQGGLTLSSMPQHDALYLFTAEDGGFVLVAADDAARPVLGYSQTGTFDATRLPASLSEWMDGYQRELEHLRQAPMPTSPEWEEVMALHAGNKDSADVVGPLMTTIWYQTVPYNDSCPQHAMTGCVATATAQIMKYWNFPPFGEGSHTYNAQQDMGVLSADFAHTRYDWDNMPDELLASSPVAARRAVAQLMYHIGVGVEMGYGIMESGASCQAFGDENYCAENAMRHFFHYDYSDMDYRLKGDINNADWAALLISDLRANRRPILYSGGVHTFVCDGYDERGLLHFNLGEGGMGDGFYAIGAISLGGISFNTNNQALLGIHPDRGLFVNEARFDFVRGGGSREVWIHLCEHCTDDVAATTSADWIGVSGDFATGVFSVTCAENNSGSVRSGTVSLTQGGRTVTIVVAQSAYDPEEYCQLTVEMENTHNEAWSGGAYLSFESPDGFVYGEVAHNVGSRTSTATVNVAPKDVVVVWHAGGPRDRYINYKIVNQHGETVVDVENAYYNAGDVLIPWPCAHLDFDVAECHDALTIYPNPASDEVKIEGLETTATVHVVSLEGREVLTVRTNGVVPVASLSPGFYFVRVELGSGNVIKKLIVK